jgi:hypothetical protein
VTFTKITKIFSVQRLLRLALPLVVSLEGAIIVSVWAQPMLSPPAQLPKLEKSRQANTAKAAQVPTSVVELETQMQLLESRMAQEERFIDEEGQRMSFIDSSSRALMTFAGAFAILLGLGSWKILEDQRQQAKDGLANQTKTFEEKFKDALSRQAEQFQQSLNTIHALRDEVHDDFPMFSKIQKNFVRILDDLRFACRGLQPLDDTYELLEWKDKQRILFYEKAIADTFLLDTRGVRVELSEIYRLLGVFYGSRYAEAYSKARGAAPKDDVERARFYFEQATDSDEGNYLAYSHAGHFTMYYDDPELAEVCRRYLLRAAQCGSKKQKPLVNLALLELRAFKNPNRCLEVLREAGVRPEWELSGSQSKNAHISYIEACALAEKAQGAAEPAENLHLCEAALICLETASAAADGWTKSAFCDGDYQESPDRDGAFQQIAKHQIFVERYGVVADKIESADKKR